MENRLQHGKVKGCGRKPTQKSCKKRINSHKKKVQFYANLFCFLSLKKSLLENFKLSFNLFLYKITISIFCVNIKLWLFFLLFYFFYIFFKIILIFFIFIKIKYSFVFSALFLFVSRL